MRLFTRRAVSLTTGIVMATALIASVAAETTQIVQSITGGGQPTVTVTSASLAPASYSAEDQQSAGQMVYTIDAATGEAEGWTVTVQSSDLVYSGDHGGQNIPAANLAIAVANQPTYISGDGIDPANGPFAPAGGATGSLDQPRTVLLSNPGFGHGVYQQVLDLLFTIPGDSKVGDYSGTITFTSVAGP